MADIEKVIKGLECCYDVGGKHCYEGKCPYASMSDPCREQLAKDALELLRGHEAVEPNTTPSAKGYWYTCGNCGWWLFEVRDTVHFDDRKLIRFCASCGCAVKWDA